METTLMALFAATSVNFGLPPELLSSLCWVESTHRPEVVVENDGGSPSYGICQIKSDTAKFVGFKGTVNELRNPKINIYYAGKYLAHQRKRYNGSLQKAIIAYNRGSAGQLTTTKYSEKVINRWLTTLSSRGDNQMSNIKTTVVLLSGKQGSGKTTLQKALVAGWDKQRNHKAFALNFADPIYHIHDAVRNIGDQYGIPRKEPKDGPLLQVLGTEWGRNSVSENLWVDCLKHRVKLYEGHYKDVDHLLIVVGDCRFENEFDLFPEAVKVRLEAATDIRKERCSQWRPNDTHGSEVGLDAYAAAEKFDITINTEVNQIDTTVTNILQRIALK